MDGFWLEPRISRSPPPLVTFEKELRPSVLIRTQNQFRKLAALVGVVAVATAFFIVPIWILIRVVGEDILAALWSKTIFVGIFGLLMACVLYCNIVVLSNSSTYATVLMVFVALIGEQFQGQGEVS
ncbi:hypothetical protein QBC36DRAFT_200141 [Triangularia setosa]|uniref:Uncharacterized protein n=1 Tax=Triangularia setosa TaxID=2587417 RepID=A0AAN6VWN4_9PEZI|nr:hypothetical protein QBC36DRAFT_200141 [Podospora setosa]